MRGITVAALSVVLLAGAGARVLAQAPSYMMDPKTGLSVPVPQSLGIYGPSAVQEDAPATQPTGGNWVTFTDPVEHAFSIELPAGWNVQGGVHRLSDEQVPSWVRAVSPGNRVEVFFGDPDLSMFAQPNQVLDMAGFHEGTVAPVLGQQLPVQHYLTGAEFAAGWGTGRIARSCGAARVAAARPLPEASQSIDMAFAASGSQVSIEAGEATMTCASGTGYVFAATEKVATGVADNAIWQVQTLGGFVATAGTEGNAADVLAHAAASFRIDPAWQMQANQTAGVVSQIVATAGEAMSHSIAERFAYAQRTNDADFQRTVNAVRGEHTYYDATSHQTFHLDNVAAHYWIGPGHPVPVPTNGSNPPFPGARELKLEQ